MLSVCPDATLVDIDHDIPPQDVLGGRARARGGVPLLSPRHRLSRGRRSWRGTRASRRSRPRRATTASSRPTTACCRSVLQQTPPTRVVELPERKYARPHRQPHVRGPRSLRAGGRLACPGHRRSRHFGPVIGDRSARHARAPSAVTDARRRRRSPARRSLRQSDHEHRSTRRWRLSPARDRIEVARGAAEHRSRSSGPTPTRRRTALRAHRQHRPSRDCGQRRQRRRRRLGATRGTAVHIVRSPDRVPDPEARTLWYHPRLP